MEYYKKTDEIIALLTQANEMLAVRQINNARLISLMPGEILDTVCSVLRTYEISQPALFYIIKEPAEELLQYAKSLGRLPVANFHLLEELSQDASDL
ncbi:hypothetical protein [Chitinophaga sp.]|uniref:hypothetical protein n=1 Tax=Chitinophaga sp. TaxID=1869181 RepID=UPI0031D3645D